jgi:hypothetical protein
MLLQTKNILAMPKTMGKRGGSTGGMQWVRTAPAAPLEENSGIPYLNCEYYLYWNNWYPRKYSNTNTVGHHVTLFLMLVRNTSTVRTNLRNKCSAQNAGNGFSGLQIISKMFWGTMPPHPHIVMHTLWKPPNPQTNQVKTTADGKGKMLTQLFPSLCP